MDDFYKTLPVIIVNNWDEINDNDLNEKYEFYFNKLQKWKEDNVGWELPEYWCK